MYHMLTSMIDTFFPPKKCYLKSKLSAEDNLLLEASSDDSALNTGKITRDGLASSDDSGLNTGKITRGGG